MDSTIEFLKRQFRAWECTWQGWDDGDVQNWISKLEDGFGNAKLSKYTKKFKDITGNDLAQMNELALRLLGTG